MNGSHYRCSICNQEVKLYRPCGEFLRRERITCKVHIPERSRDWYVPLIEDLDGTVWGYMSCPGSAIARWEMLPDTPPVFLIRAAVLVLAIIAALMI